MKWNFHHILQQTTKIHLDQGDYSLHISSNIHLAEHFMNFVIYLTVQASSESYHAMILHENYFGFYPTVLSYNGISL